MLHSWHVYSLWISTSSDIFKLSGDQALSKPFFIWTGFTDGQAAPIALRASIIFQVTISSFVSTEWEHALTKRVLKAFLSSHIIPWSRGCNILVVFERTNVTPTFESSRFFRLWGLQLSNVNEIRLRFDTSWLSNFESLERNEVLSAHEYFWCL